MAVDERELLHLILDIGEDMVLSGAEVSRVEETIVRMGSAYGAVNMEVFVITSSMVVTMETAQGYEVTQTRRICGPAGTDFVKLEAYNALSRRCCEKVMSIQKLREEIQRIQGMKLSKGAQYLGSILAAGAFCVFFGGSVPDSAVAALFAVVICLLQNHLEPICPNRVIFNFLAAVLTGVGICLSVRILPGLHMDKIIIGDIMLLIPGIAMTNAVRDVLAGDTISGSMRLTESVLWAAALAFGYMAAIVLMGGMG